MCEYLIFETEWCWKNDIFLTKCKQKSQTFGCCFYSKLFIDLLNIVVCQADRFHVWNSNIRQRYWIITTPTNPIIFIGFKKEGANISVKSIMKLLGCFLCRARFSGNIADGFALQHFECSITHFKKEMPEFASIFLVRANTARFVKFLAYTGQ